MADTLAEHYTKILGWGLVSLRGKRPYTPGWPGKPITNGNLAGNIGLNHGYSGTCVLDIDHISGEFALSVAGIDLAELLAAAPYKIIGDPDNPPKPLFRLPPDSDLKTNKLAWPHPENKERDITIFELRGGDGFQDVLPPSIHPDTQNPYIWVDNNIPQSAKDIPVIPRKLLNLWLNWDEKLPQLTKACPWVEPAADPPGRSAPPRGNIDPGVVSETFNAQYTPAEILERNGYKLRGKKWLGPHSKTGDPGVMLLRDGRKIKSYHGTCPLSDGKPHDAYDCYVILEHGGNRTAAWQAAKDDLGIKFEAAQVNGQLPTIEDDSTPENVYLLGESPDDEGNAQSINYLYAGRFLYSDALGWLTYNGQFWQRENVEAHIDRAIVDTLKRRRVLAVRAENEKLVRVCKPSSHNVRNCKYLFRSLVSASAGEFDNDPDLLNCSNGVINLRTGEFTPHDPTQRFTYCIPVDYDPEADDSEWAEWVYNTITPQGIDDDGTYAQLAEWLQMAVGYSLTGHTYEQCLFYLQGPPRAGKGVFLQAIASVLGRPLSSAVDFDSFTAKRGGDNQNFDLAPLKACRMVLASESERTTMLNAKRVKAITGNDPIYCAFKRKDFFTYTPQFKIWLSSNFKVMGDANDDALWSRLRIVLFPNSYLGQEDYGLLQRLTDNPERILKWAVLGAMTWYKRHAANIGLGRPDIINREIASQRNENDTVKQFIDECCIIGTDYHIVGTEFTANYRGWCEENGHKPLGGKKLKESLTRFNCIYQAKWLHGKTVKCYTNIGVLA